MEYFIPLEHCMLLDTFRRGIRWQPISVNVQSTNFY